MADNFGLKIGIEGEKEFKNAIREINQSFKVLGSEMNLVASQFDKQDKSVEAVTARNKVLNNEIELQKEKIATLEKALANAASSFGETDKRTQSWQIQLNNVKAELNKMERELEANNKALDNAGKEFDEAEKQADEFGREIKKAADQADDAGGRFEKLGGVLKGIGVAMGAALAAIGTAAVGAGKALVDMSVNSAAYADEILTASTVTGMSTDSLQAYKYAAELVDVSLDTLTGSMAKNVRSMSSARKGTGEVADAYRQLGISVTDANGNLRDSETVYWETIDALGKVSNETERDVLAMQIFGKSAQELNPLIAQGSAGIAELTEEAKRMGAVMSEDSLNAFGKFDDSIQRLKAGSAAAKNMLGTVLLPQLQILADDGVTLLGEFTRGLSEAGGDWTKISEVIGNTVGSLVNMLMENLPNLIQVGLDIVTSIGGAIVDNLPVIIDAAVQIVMTLLQALIDALPQITEGALQLVMALVQGIIDNLPALEEAAVQMIATLASGIGEALPELIPAVVEAIILIAEVLLDNMDKILDAAFQIIQGLAQGLLNALPKLIEALPRIITTIIDFVTNNMPKIIELGITLIVQLAAGLVKAIPELVKSLPQIVAAIIEGLGKAVVSVVEIGKNIVKGIWEGIKSLGSWIKDKVSGFFSGIVDGVKNFLGIRSPSTVFEGIGGNMALGIGEGFDKAMARVADDMQNAVPTDFNISPDISVSGRGGFSDLASGPLVVVQQMIVRGEEDIRRISQELYNLMQTGSRAQGHFITA
ncbi:phage tail protein [Clostridium thermosuccinogenes]|uniref:Phage tail protein n=1 Tax=Clostridium thermosuccinogenes TaxID=84032 RepID=A0A2K2FGA7_9CLOT|nr:phage tail protein [Pseudoclostridium thermosuccinogenes]AUS97335.1 phage tail protein [Pseudoclostridium thermosuccinogenes]PNT96195.1 phage tail protein [Pseudoclostridium thermosuccinogenes]PNT97817.1 phage tail protein [Pseudoclostridium thermosuccinogenes]